MRIMRKLVVFTIIGLSALVVLDNAQANDQIQSQKFAGEVTESSVNKWIDSAEYAVFGALPLRHRCCGRRLVCQKDLLFSSVDSGRVIHSGGANDSEHTRIGLYFGYIPSWLRPIENSAVTQPDEFSRDGRACHSTNVGLFNGRTLGWEVAMHLDPRYP